MGKRPIARSSRNPKSRIDAASWRQRRVVGGSMGYGWVGRGYGGDGWQRVGVGVSTGRG